LTKADYGKFAGLGEGQKGLYDAARELIGAYGLPGFFT
jgi:hypothetical protein